MRVHTYECDVCGAQKKKTNRWWLVRASACPAKIEGTIQVLGPHESIQVRTVSGVQVLGWDGELADQPDVRHVCGEQHAQELVARFMQGGTLEPCKRPASMPAGGAS